MEKKKKILHIAESWGSGVFSFIVDLANSTYKDYDIVIAHGIREETFENYADYFNNEIKLVKVKSFTRNINPINDFKAFLELKKIIKEEKPDIIHLHSSKAGFLGRFAANTKKYKMYYNPHGFSFLMQDSSKIKRLIYFVAEKIAALRKCTIIGCSKGEYEEALKLTKNSICINNGVNIDILKNQVQNLKEKEIDFDNLKICTSGRIGYQKNPELFNSIAKELPNVKFTWIGDGDEKDKLNSPNINVTGWKSKEEVIKILNENDVFILASLWEGLPISLLEAMYLKKICLVSNCIGNRDVISSNENGFVCKNKDEFVSLIKKLKNIEYKKIQYKAYEDINETFNTSRMVEEYRKIYEEK
jgi:glycosyltransferase involved in cell wall biosynthesis